MTQAPSTLSIRAGDGTTVGDPVADGTRTLREVVVAPGARLDLRWEVPLGTATGYWHPGAGADRTLPADWAGRTATSLVSGAPVGCLHDAAGRTLLGWALDELVEELEIRYGVSEERKTFVLQLTAAPASGTRRLSLALTGEPAPLADAVGELTGWLAARLEVPPLTVPPLARQPVYSTWYTFTQDLDQSTVLAEVELAAGLGCRSVFVDDGWQRLAVGRGYAGCGDWQPDPAKFGDLAGFSAAAHKLGAGVVLWIAPLLLGPESDVAGRLAAYAPVEQPHLRCAVLDPRHREVREHVADTCRRLVLDYALDGLKIDFLDQAIVYRGTPTDGDLDDVGQAMQALLALVRERLVEAGRPEVAIEFRQPYVSPAIGAYGQILRAGDCPGDAVVNRRSTVDARLLAVGQVVHGDMLLWGPTGGAEAVAAQLYGSWFAVPQISMRLAELDAEQLDTLRRLLALWQEQAPVVLDGTLSVQGSEHDYSLVRADRADLSRAVIGRYAPVVVDLDRTGETTVLNATAEPSVVLRVAGGHAVRDGVVRDAGGRPVADVGALGPGLHELAVPPYGSTTVTVTPAA